MSTLKCQKLLFIGLILFSSLSAGNARDKKHTLCNEDEDVYFSCPLDNGKITSVCAQNNTSPYNGYVQYRYGFKNNIEMEYPSTKLAPANKFYYIDYSGGSVESYLLVFDVEKDTYAVNQNFTGQLMVFRDGKVISRLGCDAGGFAVINQKAVQGVQHRSRFSLGW